MWLVTGLALYLAGLFSLSAVEGACEQVGLPERREGSRLEADDWGLVTHCKLTQPDGSVFETTEVHWYPAVIFLSFGVGARFAIAGLLGLVAVRRATFWVLASGGALLIASLIWFSGVP